MGTWSCPLNTRRGFCPPPPPHIPAPTQHAGKCTPTITTAQRDDGHGFCGSLNVKCPLWARVYTDSPAGLCYSRLWHLLEMQPPLKEEGHWGRTWRFYGQVQLRVHSLMPYLSQAASCHVIMSCLPWKTEHFLHWRAKQTLLLSGFLDIWSQQ